MSKIRPKFLMPRNLMLLLSFYTVKNFKVQNCAKKGYNTAENDAISLRHCVCALLR